MPATIPRQTVQDIRQLLAQGGLSYRAIAQQTGVSRATVRAVDRGERSDDAPPRPVPQHSLRPLAPPKRCPTCGGLVYPPCRLCATRRLAGKRKNPEPRQPAPPGDPLALDLHTDHRRRYQRIRALRQAQNP